MTAFEEGQKRIPIWTRSCYPYRRWNRTQIPIFQNSFSRSSMYKSEDPLTVSNNVVLPLHHTQALLPMDRPADQHPETAEPPKLFRTYSNQPPPLENGTSQQQYCWDQTELDLERTQRKHCFLTPSDRRIKATSPRSATPSTTISPPTE